ncbi:MULTISPECIES: redoxin domain-containing protein [unclassified Brevibacterium]|uniref:redoxin domain-containing protein n=1 Tax=unclassified Brevibacterium TaxID=2614124 RepID=UPI0010F93B85|nr:MULTISPECIES: redoxin domain-containing protein [unclassified Brevibacterium]MCM1012308.1 redoxin domain-containing protein [Brevibacterium sp. XM4083]
MIPGPGDRAPDFSVTDQFGRTITLAEATGSSVVILAFLPYAFSPVCGDEIRALQEIQDDADAAGDDLTVIAITADAKYTLAAWGAERGVNLSIGSDFWPHGAVARAYGVFDEDHGVAERGVFVITKAGTIESGRQVARTETRDFAIEARIAAGIA